MDGGVMLTQNELSDLFEYRDGRLYSRVFRGKITPGTCIGNRRKDGYFHAEINKRKYLLHRLIFTLKHGYTPVFIDHINGDRSDNRIENLRDVTRGQNNRNAKRRKNSRSGVKGVSWYAKDRKWVVRLYIDGKNKYFGSFDLLEDAEKHVQQIREQLHGPYARHC